MEQLTATPEGYTAALAPATCEKCGKPALARCMWDWGESYLVCGEHQALAVQTNENLASGQRVHFVPIPTAPAPMTRDERTRLKGNVYALEEEIVDLKARGSDLYRENTALTRQVQAGSVRLRETELQLTDARQDLQQVVAKLEERDAEHGALVDEVQRLRTMSKVFDDQTVKIAGLEAKLATLQSGESVVEGTTETHGVEGQKAPITRSSGNKPPKNG